MKHILNMHFNFNHSGFHLCAKSHMLGDNTPIVYSSRNPQSKIHVGKLALSFQSNREAVHAKAVSHKHTHGKDNPVGMLNNYCIRHKIPHMLKLFLF